MLVHVYPILSKKQSEANGFVDENTHGQHARRQREKKRVLVLRIITQH
jgi:hypothetical protein